MYFNKAAKELTLDEGAMIAAIIQAPERLSPFVDPRRTTNRRNYVLQRMADEGLVPAADARAAIERPLVLRGQQTPERFRRTYFVKHSHSLEQKYGAKELYEAGLRVRRPRCRTEAGCERRVDRGLRRSTSDSAIGGERTSAPRARAGGYDDRWTRPIAEATSFMRRVTCRLEARR